MNGRASLDLLQTHIHAQTVTPVKDKSLTRRVCCTNLLVAVDLVDLTYNLRATCVDACVLLQSPRLQLKILRASEIYAELDVDIAGILNFVNDEIDKRPSKNFHALRMNIVFLCPIII